MPVDIGVSAFQGYHSLLFFIAPGEEPGEFIFVHSVKVGVPVSYTHLDVYKRQVPDSVAINEAVELAKKFGQDESSGFVNGVLARFV